MSPIQPFARSFAGLVAVLLPLTFFGGLFYCAFQILGALRAIRVELALMNRIMQSGGGRPQSPAMPADGRG